MGRKEGKLKKEKEETCEEREEMKRGNTTPAILAFKAAIRTDLAKMQKLRGFHGGT